MNAKTKAKETKNPMGHKVTCKSRMIDPFFDDEGGKKRISDKDSEWIKILRTESKPKVYFLEFADDLPNRDPL